MTQELFYDNTRTYLISAGDGYLLFDTGWAGTFPKLCKALGEKGVKLSDIRYLLISHFHPDHMGLAGELAQQGIPILVMESQTDYVHSSDHIFARDKRISYVPISDEHIKVLSFAESREFLCQLGVEGCILPTPGHSEDSISLCLDDGDIFVGDLYPLYELEVHEETAVKKSWENLLSLKPKRVFYGHAKAAVLECAAKKEATKEVAAKAKCPEGEQEIGEKEQNKPNQDEQEYYLLTKKIMQYVDKGMHVDKITKKLRADKTFVNDVCRMYLTHRNVSVQGILDRIEIKGR